jgi:hypothetical protein
LSGERKNRASGVSALRGLVVMYAICYGLTRKSIMLRTRGKRTPQRLGGTRRDSLMCWQSVTHLEEELARGEAGRTAKGPQDRLGQQLSGRGPPRFNPSLASAVARAVISAGAWKSRLGIPYELLGICVQVVTALVFLFGRRAVREFHDGFASHLPPTVGLLSGIAD